MSKLKTIALAAGFTALSGNALARETPAESRDSVSTNGYSKSAGTQNLCYIR